MDTKIYSKLADDFYALENQGYEVLGVFVQGSQNYELEYENSDIDTKAIVLPKFCDLCCENKPISYTKINNDNSHCDIKDIREMFKNFLKQNVNYLEILFTKYRLINPTYEDIFDIVLTNNERIARYNTTLTVKSIAGMSLQKLKALEHPYPIWKEHIDKYGFSNKQLHHIKRLNEFQKRYINGENFGSCLIAKDKKELIRIKAEPQCFNLEEARILANKWHDETWEMKDKYMENNACESDREVEKILSNALVNILQRYYTREFSMEND